MIRPAKHSDLPAIVSICVEAVGRSPTPLKVSVPAMRETLRTLIGNPGQFVWVAEDGGVVVAAVAASVGPGLWFTRAQCSVLLYFTRVPGMGLALIRELVRWIRSRPVIKAAVFELEPESDPRLSTFLRRIGFSRQSANLTYLRGAT